MSIPRPHFLLFCDGSLPNQAESPHISNRGRWRFVLENVEGQDRLEASDAESNQAPDRLALLAVVRGLEALSQPSRVTLVTSSRYVNRGLQYGLPEWRENSYCWEHFGTIQPIRNADLWQRIDRATKYHSIHCRLMSGEEATEESDNTNDELTRIIVEENQLPAASGISSVNVASPVEVHSEIQFEQEVGKTAGNRFGKLFPLWVAVQSWCRQVWRRWMENRYVMATV